MGSISIIQNFFVTEAKAVVNLATALASIDKKILVIDMEFLKFLHVFQCL